MLVVFAGNAYQKNNLKNLQGVAKFHTFAKRKRYGTL